MQENKNKVHVTSLFRHSDKGFKIAGLRFPVATDPGIGMTLKDNNDMTYTISGIVFERRSDGIWDCKLEDSFDSLVPGCDLYIVEQDDKS